jgi:hypothetical protein
MNIDKYSKKYEKIANPPYVERDVALDNANGITWLKVME